MVGLNVNYRSTMYFRYKAVSGCGEDTFNLKGKIPEVMSLTVALWVMLAAGFVKQSTGLEFRYYNTVGLIMNTLETNAKC